MIDLLKEYKVFNECTSQELDEVARMCQRITFKEGERIFEADSPAEYLYIVGKGAIELRFKITHYQAPKEITLDRKFKGDAFGWSGLTEPYAYSLSAVAMQDAELLKLKASNIERLCLKNNHFGYVFMKNISEIIAARFATLQRLVVDMIQEHLKEKER